MSQLKIALLAISVIAIGAFIASTSMIVCWVRASPDRIAMNQICAGMSVYGAMYGRLPDSMKNHDCFLALQAIKADIDPRFIENGFLVDNSGMPWLVTIHDGRIKLDKRPK